MTINVRYGDQTLLFDLPAQPRNDPYNFLQEQIEYATSTRICNQDLQVTEVGGRLPAHAQWPRDQPLKSGTYRAILIPQAHPSPSRPEVWSLELDTSNVQYPHNWSHQWPKPLSLLLALAEKGCQTEEEAHVARLHHYAVSNQVLELAYFRKFCSSAPTYTLESRHAVEQSVQQSQQQYFSQLRKCGLMLRISSFALGTDLLLYPNGKGQLFGFITRAGMIEEQATAEYNYYIQRKQLVLVLDLDETLLRTMRCKPENMEAWNSGLGIMLKTTAGSDKLFTIPRANLLQFFRCIRNKYHIYFCTAGNHEYAQEVMRVLQTHLLEQVGLTPDEKGWISEHINERSALSTQSVNTQDYKSLGMLLMVGYHRKLASRLVIIFDDTKQVWRDCDQSLVCVPPKQMGATSHHFESTALLRFGAHFENMHSYVFGQNGALQIPLAEVPNAMHMSYLQHGK